MTIESFKDWADIASKIAIPFILAWLGLRLAREMESRKAEVNRISDFQKRWADDFYIASQAFLGSTERYAAALNFLQSMSNPNSPLGTNLQQELSILNVTLGEQQLRLVRYSSSAVEYGSTVAGSSQALLAYLSSLVASGKGSLDKLKDLQHSFHDSARNAHEELLRNTRNA